jgi:penicillin-binding protein 1B
MARKRSRRGGTWWLVPLAFFLAALLVAAGVLCVFAERKLSMLVLGGLGESFSTRVYAAPYALPQGAVVPPARLLARLDRAGYQKSKTLERTGDYTWDGKELRLALRGFQTPIDSEPAGRYSLTWDGTQWDIKTDIGAPAARLRLEPELAAELSGARKVRREPAESDEIPDALKKAVVAAEDKRFYTHWGVDPRGIARALWSNIAHRGAPMQGGSTITQQLSKNLFLSPQRNLRRKIAEAGLALYLELRYSKDRILTIYLNHIYLGQEGPVSIAGVKAAARFYFARDLKELTPAECATIAGLIRSPHRYNPFLNPSEALERRDFVLKHMHDDGYLTDAQLAQEVAKPLGVVKTKTKSLQSHDNDYFVAEVERILIPRLGDETLFRHGLSVYTTLDALAQRDAQRAVTAARPQAALVALDARTGDVLALSGGRDFTESQFNRATQARRQPGSAFKPFVYGAALEKGYTAASMLDDSPRKYPRAAEGPTWDPRNYEGVYFGTTTLRTAITHSLNAATLDLAGQIGIASVIEFARRMGISTPLAPDLGTALGASEVTLFDLASAYQVFAAGGVKRAPRLVTAVVDAEGTVLEADPPQESAVLDPAIAWLLTSLLQSVVREGTARPLAAWGWTRPTAGKTGTTNDGRDAWFVGYTPQLVAAVWYGDDQHRKLNATGAKSALPVWAAFMKAAAQEYAPEDFLRPDGIVEEEIDPQSGLKAVTGCPTRVTEVFKRGTEPTTDCPLHPSGVKGFFQRLFRRKR